MPIAASPSAISAKPPSTRSCTTRGAVSSDTTSSSVRMFVIGSCGSALRMMSRTAGMSVDGGTEVRTIKSCGA
jgi:hypothetical protein